MVTNREIVDKFYQSIALGDAASVAELLDDDFELGIPINEGVLSGHYHGKTKFMTEVLPLVFSCVNQDEITFCKDYKIVSDDGETSVAIAQTNGIAKTGLQYDQVYIHVLKFCEGKLIRLIEYFDSALADRALWGESSRLTADKPFDLSSI